MNNRLDEVLKQLSKIDYLEIDGEVVYHKFPIPTEIIQSDDQFIDEPFELQCNKGVISK